MAGVNKSGSKSEVKNSTVDQVTSMIPPGEEHNRCREALENAGAGVNFRHQDGLTPLMFALEGDHAQCVNELIKAGANANTLNSRGVSTLMLAIDRWHPKYVDLLIKAGADVNQKNIIGIT